MQKLALLFLALVASTIPSDAFATQIQIVTDLGNVFTAQKTPSSLNSTSNDAVLGAGLGTAARIQTVQPQGTLVYGSGYIGTTTPIQPYVSIPQGTNFAALIQENDSSISSSMPEFYSTYDYSNGQLVQEPGPPNILSFTDTKLLSGNVSPTISSNNVQISASPSGTILMKMNSLAGRQVILRGTIPSGDDLQYVLADPSVDLTKLPYGTANGWTLADSPASFSYSNYRATYSWTCGYVNPYYPRYPWWPGYWECWQYQSGSVPTSMSASVQLDFTVPDAKGLVAYLQATSSHSYKYCYARYDCTWRTDYSTSDTPASISGYQTSNGFHVTGISYSSSNYNGVSAPSSAIFVIYNKTPYLQLLNFDSNFEQTYTFPNDNRQLYLISTQPNAGVIATSAQQYDPNMFSYLKINGLPPDTPYEIVKNGMVGAAGLTPSDGSPMMFDVSQIGFQAGDQLLGGLLILYPNSLWYRGTITSLVLDTINKNSFNYDGPSQIHIPFAFVRVPIPTNVAISKVSIDDGTIQVPYLSGQYESGTALLIPTIPSMKNVEFSANGTPMKIAISDVIGDAGVTVLSGKSASDSHYSLTTAVSADAGVDGEVTAIATHDGILNGIISVTVSANANYYSGSSTLAVYVKTYVNGNLAGTKTLYTSQPPIGYSSQTIQSYTISPSFTQYGSYGITQTNPYPYSVDSFNISNQQVSGTVTVPAHTGDLVEFEVYAGENAQSAMITTAYNSYCNGWMGMNINTGKEGCYTYGYNPTAHLSEASATVSLDEGYILTG
ncbi:MAG: hypothetical protein KGI27_11015 [Thaumarchaeota archaeon]|nr:hypothetical protein [Nitrososphaerota archaeon]